MDEVEQRERVRKVLERVKEEYGFVPLVSEVMSDRPDVYLPYSEMSSRLFFRPKHLDRQTVELAAIAASTALGSKNCLDVHILQAIKLGLSEEAIMEAMMVGSFMSMNGSNAIAFRCLLAAQENCDEGGPR
ncbi:MAG: carboxymuconolactone decarboxylase family protein [Methanomassiliicoccales archaeon]|nr:carboxymuconolactone decarboxylase family protein [Methanomassiliicoccales archaeon]